MIHPELPAGFNADDINGDDFNGPGTNWTVWPNFYETFIPLPVFILTPEMLEAFEECADLILPCIDNLIRLPAECTTVAVDDRWPETAIAAVSNTIVLPDEERVLMISDSWPGLQPPSVSKTIDFPRGVREQVIEED